MPKAKTAQSRAETTEQLAPSGAGNKENSLLQFDVRIQSIRPGESIKGTASVNINGAFAIRGVKIIEGSNGLFVSMPSYKVGNEYKDICFPITQECRKQLHEAVIGAYEQAISQDRTRWQSIMGCRHRKDSRWRWQECNRIKPENIERTAQERSGRP